MATRIKIGFCHMEILSFIYLFYLIVYMMHAIMLSYCIRNKFGLMIVMFILIFWLLRMTSNQYDLDPVFFIKAYSEACQPSINLVHIQQLFVRGNIFSGRKVVL